MGRSGTTYVTEFLGKCGVFLDEVNWAHEHELARLVNDTILAQAFGAGPGLPYGKLPDGEITLPDYWHRMARFFVKYMDTLAGLEGGNRCWAFKDPRTTILHSIWLDHFDVVIGMFRAPQEVVSSYLGQGWIKGWRKARIALDYWKRFNQSLLHIYHSWQKDKDVYVLDYDGDVTAQTMALCGKLGIAAPEDAKSLFDPSRKHYKGGELPRDRMAIKLYEDLKSASMGVR
jgi:hypothetical protein